jgi:hypothetical protein
MMPKLKRQRYTLRINSPCSGWGVVTDVEHWFEPGTNVTDYWVLFKGKTRAWKRSHWCNDCARRATPEDLERAFYMGPQN